MTSLASIILRPITQPLPKRSLWSDSPSSNPFASGVLQPSAFIKLEILRPSILPSFSYLSIPDPVVGFYLTRSLIPIENLLISAFPAEGFSRQLQSGYEKKSTREMKIALYTPLP